MLVLDTHVLVWMDSGHERLGGRTRRRIDQALAKDELTVVAISFWEVAMLVSKGRIELAQPLSEWRQDLLRAGLREVPVDGAAGITAAQLRQFHADPADRMIVAVTMSLNATLVTADERLLTWDGSLKTHDARS